MNLEQFVAETLAQIARGVAKAQKDVAEAGGTVSPRNLSPMMDKGTQQYLEVRGRNMDPMAQIVEFDVALTAADAKETGGIGLQVAFAGLSLSKSGGDKDAMRNEVTSRIKFSVPVILPMHDHAFRPAT